MDFSNCPFDDEGMRGKYPKNYIKELREARGLSLEKLAQAVGVTNPHISMLELSKRGLSWAMVQKLADALDCHPIEITEGPNDKIDVKTPMEKEIVRAFRGLEDGEKRMFLHMIQNFDKTPATKPKKPRK